ncbi:hypothetical protein J7M28_05505, partial [bacterium]|nr:hypothetical protein [bacterium]
MFVGPVHSGKNQPLYEELAARLSHDAANGLAFLVPCYSFARQIEAAMLDRLGGFLSFPLTTFRPLFRELYSCLRDDRRLVGDAAREVIIMGILKSASPLPIMGQLGPSRGVCRALGRFFATLGRHSHVNAGDARAAIEGILGKLDGKLDEALRLYEIYRRVLENNRLIDAEHAGILVCEAIRGRDKGILRRLSEIELLMVDGFFTFSPLEQNLLLSLIELLPETWVSLDIDKRSSPEVFELSRRALKALEQVSDSIKTERVDLPANHQMKGTRKTLSEQLYT